MTQKIGWWSPAIQFRIDFAWKKGFKNVFVVADLRLHPLGAGRCVVGQRPAGKETKKLLQK